MAWRHCVGAAVASQEGRLALSTTGRHQEASWTALAQRMRW